MPVGRKRGRREGTPGCQVAPEWRRGPLGSALPREGCREPGLCGRLEAGTPAPPGAAVTPPTWTLGVTGAPAGGRTRVSGSGKAQRVLMLKIFLRSGNMVVLCLIEKEVSLILVLHPNFEYKKINGVRGMAVIFTEM